MALWKKFAIDFGSKTTSVWEEGQGIVLTEPTALVRDAQNGGVLAVGAEAMEMMGRQPEYMEVVSPMAHGVVVDYEGMVQFAKYIFKKVAKGSWLFGVEVLIPLSYGTNEVEQRAMIDALKAAGARRVLLVDGPLATALGAKVPVAEPFGNMVVSLGEATSDAAVLSLGGIVVAKGMRWGGVDMDLKLIEYLRKTQNLHIGDQMARQVREKYLCAMRPKHPEAVEVSGRDTVYGLPKNLTLNSDMVYEGLKDGVAHIASLCVGVLSQTPPELVGDIMDRGVILTGGLSNTRDLAKYLTQTLNVAVHIASEPAICTIRGAGMILENIEVYERAVR